MTAMEKTDPGSNDAEPLDPAIARFLRSICTTFGLHRGCPYKVCRRANACATRNAVCYQAMKADMQPIVLSIIARDWRRSVDQGEERDLAPAYRDDHIRRLAWEEEEIARIKSGACGGDDALTTYQFWLKYWVARVPRAAGGRAGRTGGKPSAPAAGKWRAPPQAGSA